MCTATAIAWTSLVIAFASFVLFGWIVVRRIRATRIVAAPAGLGEAAETQAAVDIGEAAKGFAKLVEALSKAPEAVVAVSTAMIFMVMAIVAAAFECKCKPRGTPSPASETTYGLKTSAVPCVVSAFPDGEHRIPQSSEPQGLKPLKEKPVGCVEGVVSQGQSEEIAFLLLVGHADIRELNPSLRAIYRTNNALAYQRALSLRDHILSRYQRMHEEHGTTAKLSREELGLRIVVLSAGPSNVGGHVDPSQLENDRSVEIWPYWISLIKPVKDSAK